VAETQAGPSQEQTGADVWTPRQAAAGAGAAPAGTAPAGTAPAGTAPAGTAPASTGQVSQEAASAVSVPLQAGPMSGSLDRAAVGAIHHVELWVPDLDRAIVSWGWLLTALGYRMFQDWPGGRSWRTEHAYIVVEQSPARTAGRHDRCRPGLNHLAFHVGTRAHADELTREAQLHGWKLMFADLHPFAGGAGHYAAYLENADGFEVELVADE